MSPPAGDPLDAPATWEAMATGVVALTAARDVVAVRGPDAVTWMQGQVSQDVSVLAVGESTDSLLLSPEGRMVALVRVSRPAADEVLLDADPGAGAAVVERLRRFRLRVKAEIEQLEWRFVALRGPAAGAVAADVTGGSVLALPWRWPGDEGWDLLGPDATVPDGVPEGDGDAAEAARIVAGIPRHGVELTDRTIPHEAGVVERSVSFTKGCYTGQELVARLDARGARVPRRLRGVVLPDGSLEPGEEIRADGRAVGTATRAARVPGTSVTVGLAYVRREVDPPAACETDSGSGTVEALPISRLAPGGTTDRGDEPAG